MVEILEDRKLSFMFPLLRVQADLWRQIRVDPNPGNFYKWIKENVDGELQVDAGFINILVTMYVVHFINFINCYMYVAQECQWLNIKNMFVLGFLKKSATFWIGGISN